MLRKRCCALILVLAMGPGCATSSPDPAALYGKQCEKQGHSPNTDAWRACLQSEELNAAIATQRSYDQKALRRLDCIGPLMACPPGP